MSGESRSHLNRSTQRRFTRVAIAVAIAVIVVLAPLIAKPDWRLDLAHRLNFVPGGDVEQLADGQSGVNLIVVPIEIQRPNNRPQYRFRALYLTRTDPEGVELTSLDTGAAIRLPLHAYDFTSASSDGSMVLFQDRRDTNAILGALVDTDTGNVTSMPVDAPYPALPGHWKESIWRQGMGSCEGFSPNAKFIACFQGPKLAYYLAGDWELQVRVYGEPDRLIDVYRGAGFRPIVGWTGNDRWLYFQNEQGVWRAEVTEDMFPPSKYNT